jgi:hypothetical protein
MGLVVGIELYQSTYGSILIFYCDGINYEWIELGKGRVLKKFMSLK